MPRPRLSDEERKEHMKVKNAICYQKRVQGKTKSGLIYVISGFADDKVYVGATKCPKQRFQRHRLIYGDGVQINEVIYHNDIDLMSLNDFENLVICLYGKERCLNKYNTYELVKERIDRILARLDGLSPAHRQYVKGAIDKLSPGTAQEESPAKTT